MNLQKIFLAGAVLALASPIAAYAQTAPTLQQADAAALNGLSSSHRAEVKNILSLLETKQLDKMSAAVQIDAVLSGDESKAVLAEAAKAHSDAQDAGVFLASF